MKEKRRCAIAGLAAMLLALPTGLAFGQIKVIEQAGVTQAEPGKETTIVFQTAEGQEVPIYQLLGESTGVAVGANGATASAYGVDLRFVCNAPAKITVPGGLSTLYVTNNAMLGTKLDIKALGGTQTWKITAPSFPKFLTGMILASIVGPATLVFGLTGMFDEASPVFAIIGAGSLGGGLYLALNSTAKATLVGSQ